MLQLLSILLSIMMEHTSSFTILNPTSPLSSSHCHSSTTHLSMVSRGRSSPISSYNKDRSKRQERVGHIVRTEIATIIQLGYPIKNQMNEIDDELRRRINVVSADVSPDLKQARITVSVIKRTKSSVDESEDDFEEFYDDDDEEEDEFDDEEDEFDEEFDDDDDDEDEDEELKLKQVFPGGSSNNGNSIVDRRRSYAWLVKNTKQIRHALSQRLSHMKTIPNLTFVLADVGAAVDVMNLIDKISKGNYKRDDIGLFGGDNDQLPPGMYLESEMDEYDDEYEWVDVDNEDEDWEDIEEDEGELKKQDEKRK